MNFNRYFAVLLPGIKNFMVTDIITTPIYSQLTNHQGVTMKNITGMIETNGIKIHYEHTGGDKPPFIFSHGITDNGRCMLRLAEHFAPRFDAITVDARGHGLSDAPEEGYSADDHADDLLGVINTLELEKPILYGHSMGARTVSRFAAKYPDLPFAVILEDPVFITPMSEAENQASQAWAAQMPEQIRRWHQMSEAELMALAKEQGHADWTTAEEIEWAKAKAQVSPQVFNMGASMRTISLDFPNITCPVLIMKADASQDVQEKNEAATNALQNGKIFHVPGAGHNIRRDNWAELIQHIEGFLKEIQ
jgi:pimeloyl-ACP methyl ester carboxylesterase